MKKNLLVALFISLLANFSLAKDVTEIEHENITETISAFSINRLGNNDIDIIMPSFVFSNTITKIQLQFKDPDNLKLINNEYIIPFIINGEEMNVKFDGKGTGTIDYTLIDKSDLSIYCEDSKYESKLHLISIWYILFPLILLSTFLIYKIKNNRKLWQRIRKKENFIASRQFTKKQKKQTVVIEEELEEDVLS